MLDRSEAQRVLHRAAAAETDAQPAPRAMLVYAHADDETIALGGRLARYAGALLIHVTDGAPRGGQDIQANGFAEAAAYSRARFAELHAALQLAGAAAMRRECLCIPDQQTSQHLPELIRMLTERINAEHPQVVFTHAYEGGHPDHDSCAFAVHHAVRSSAAHKRPLVIEAAGYHAGPQGIETGTFLPNLSATAAVERPLAAAEQARKAAMLQCFTTQAATLQYFGTEREQYRIAPDYDFTQPPHGGTLFYDNYSWGITSSEWRALAGRAAAELRSCRQAA